MILGITTFSSYTEPSIPLFDKLDILNINQLNDILISSFSFSLNDNERPPYFDVHSYNTWISEQLHKTFNRTNYGKYSTRERIIKIWNEIPKTIKCSASLKVKKIKQFILQS